MRAALYQLAFVNMGVANGPMILSTMNKHCKTIVVKVAHERAESGSEAYKKAGLDPHKPPFWANEDDNFFHSCEDTFESLKMVYNAFTLRSSNNGTMFHTQ